MEMSIVLGVIGFVLLYVYEVNQILWKKSFFKGLFTIGFLLIFASSLWVIISEFSNLTNYFPLMMGVLLFVLFMYLLIYTLFFAIPFKESYVDQFEERRVYKEKMYAICRHPGVLWFIGVYVSIYVMIPTHLVLVLAIVMSALNVIYIVIQDLWSFPKLFVDYDEYKKETPFLVPNIKSIKKTINSYMRRT